MLICEKTELLNRWGKKLLERDVLTLDADSAAELTESRKRTIAWHVKESQSELARDLRYGRHTPQKKLLEVIGWWETEVENCGLPSFGWKNALWYEKCFLDIGSYHFESPEGLRQTLAYWLDRAMPQDLDGALLERIRVADDRFRSLTLETELSFADLIYEVSPDPNTQWYFYRQPLDYPAELVPISYSQWKFAQWSIFDFLDDSSCMASANPNYIRLHSPKLAMEMEVVHWQFGKGCVKKIDAEDDCLMVDFEVKGLRRFGLTDVTHNPIIFPEDWIKP